MNAERLKLIEEIFHAAIEIPPHELESFFKEYCGADEELRQKVEALLAVENLSGNFLDSPPESLAAEMLAEREQQTNLIDKVIGHYQIIELLGKGGMGEVYLAQDIRLNRQVALKFLSVSMSGDKNLLRRFVQEAKSASALNHPNILTVHEIGEFENLRFIATEFIQGATLRERLSGEIMTLRETLDVALQVAAALNVAHDAGIAHRDIKPENIMLRNDGLVKVLDFGLAKLLRSGNVGLGMRVEKSETLVQSLPNNPKSEIPIPQLTSPGMVMGTVAYMSPEQVRGKEVDSRSDIWSLGVVVYEMLTKRTPFAGETANDSIAAILKSEPPSLSEAIPAQLRRIVSKSLQKQTEERYETVKDIVLEIKNLKRELDFSEEFERSHLSHPTNSANVSTARISENATDAPSGVISTQNSQPLVVSSAEYLVSQVRKHKFRMVLILTLAVFLFAGAGFGLYELIGNRTSKISFDSAKFSRLTSSGIVGISAISPDGKWFVYTTNDGEQQSLWLQQASVAGSSTQIVPLTATAYRGLAFSPDGDYVYYTRTEPGASTATLYQLPVLGGAARKLFAGIGGKVSFSPDGKLITYYDYEGDEDRLMIANADGTGQRQLASRRGNEFLTSGNHGPSWSPDGKTIATTVGTFKPRNMSVAAVSVETGEMNFFSSQKFNFTGDVTWVADGRSLLVLANLTEGQQKIWQISFPSGEAQKISNELNDYFTFSLTGDSNMLAAVQVDRSSNIWIAPTDDTAKTSQVTSGSDQSDIPSWTPDGKMVFVKLSGDSSDLYITDPRAEVGASPKKLTANSGSNSSPTVSPDGRFIVFRSDRMGLGFSSLWRIDIDGGNPMQLTSNNDFNPSFSPDGREIIYSSFINQNRIWKVGIDGGQPVQLTDKESYAAVFSPDGKQLACSYLEDAKTGYKIAILASGGGSPVKSFTLPIGFGSNFGSLRWMPDARSLVYTINKGGVTNLWAQPIDGGTPKQITNFTNDLIRTFNFSPDGKQLAFSRGTTTSNVILISGLKKES